MLAPFCPDDYPNLVEFITEQAMQPGYDYAHEFDIGLEAILDALERAHSRRLTSSGARVRPGSATGDRWHLGVAVDRLVWRVSAAATDEARDSAVRRLELSAEGRPASVR